MAKNSESIDKKYAGGVDMTTGKDLTVKVNIDVSDALKGLKAVQREAKKTVRVLREVEESRNFNPVINITVNSNDDPKKIAENVKAQINKTSEDWI
ncbi:hypothetical protein GN156_03980 [bacterium LRH843]|nr:hypothetical protein [bacterium LRH843]